MSSHWNLNVNFLRRSIFCDRYVSGLFCDLCILSHSITLWTVAHTFAEDLRSQSTISNNFSSGKDGTLHRKTWGVIYSEYKAIRKLSMAINTALGSTVMGFMAEAIIFYSMYLATTLVTQDIYKQIFMIYFYLNTFSILVISADICAQVFYSKFLPENESFACGQKLWLIKIDGSSENLAG